MNGFFSTAHWCLIQGFASDKAAVSVLFFGSTRPADIETPVAVDGWRRCNEAGGLPRLGLGSGGGFYTKMKNNAPAPGGLGPELVLFTEYPRRQARDGRGR